MKIIVVGGGKVGTALCLSLIHILQAAKGRLSHKEWAAQPKLMVEIKITGKIK